MKTSRKPSDARRSLRDLKPIYGRPKIIAVVWLLPNPDRPSQGIAQHLKDHGLGEK